MRYFCKHYNYVVFTIIQYHCTYLFWESQPPFMHTHSSIPSYNLLPLSDSGLIDVLSLGLLTLFFIISIGYTHACKARAHYDVIRLLVLICGIAILDWGLMSLLSVACLFRKQWYLLLRRIGVFCYSFLFW